MKNLRLLIFLFLLGAASSAPTSAATASPVGINSVTVAGSTLTVTTAAAHGLSATLPSGFCISGSSVSADNGCGVVLTAPTGTTFTFTLVTGAACSTSCGTVLPAKRVVWLRTDTVSGGYSVNYLLWIAVTASVAITKTSAWSGASVAENNAITTGAFIEINRAQFFPLGTSLANAEAQLQNDWTAQQNALTTSVQPGAFLGNFYDGVGWLQ